MEATFDEDKNIISLHGLSVVETTGGVPRAVKTVKSFSVVTIQKYLGNKYGGTPLSAPEIISIIKENPAEPEIYRDIIMEMGILYSNAFGLLTPQYYNDRAYIGKRNTTNNIPLAPISTDNATLPNEILMDIFERINSPGTAAKINIMDSTKFFEYPPYYRWVEKFPWLVLVHASRDYGKPDVSNLKKITIMHMIKRALSCTAPY